MSKAVLISIRPEWCEKWRMIMDRYINAAEAAEIVSAKTGIKLAVLVDIFAEIPPADVAPVRRGTWKIGQGNDNFDIKCSECGYKDIFGVCSVREVKIVAKLVHYCPNCGAKMDGGL